jgi:MYXO-CTERM domain-containing protein
MIVLSLLWSTAAPVSADDCTAGTDCYCDRVSDPNSPAFDPELRHCQDWEDPNWYEDCDSSVPAAPGAEGTGPPGVTRCWWKSDPNNDGYRGAGGIFQQTYGATGGSCAWTDPDPVSPQRGFSCSPGGSGICAGAEFHPSDLYQGNDKACFDIQQQGEVNAEISELTLSGGTSGNGEVWDGKAHLAARVRPDSPSSPGSAIDTGATMDDVGITMALAYSTNLLNAATPANANFINQPWKHNEWGTRGHFIGLGNTGLGGAPFSPTLVLDPAIASSNPSMPSAECLAARDGATVLEGEVGCNDVQFEFGSTFNRETEWPLGTWGCVRVYLRGISGSDGEYRVSFQHSSQAEERVVLHVQNLDFATLINEPGFFGYFWNFYYNGNEVGGTPATATFNRYYDNIHIRAGEPVPCSAIGFDGDGITPKDSGGCACRTGANPTPALWLVALVFIVLRRRRGRALPSRR